MTVFWLWFETSAINVPASQAAGCWCHGESYHRGGHPTPPKVHNSGWKWVRAGGAYVHMRPCCICAAGQMSHERHPWVSAVWWEHVLPWEKGGVRVRGLACPHDSPVACPHGQMGYASRTAPSHRLIRPVQGRRSRQHIQRSLWAWLQRYPGWGQPAFAVEAPLSWEEMP